MPSKLSYTLLKRERISKRRTGRGVIKNAPSGTAARRPGKLLREPFNLVRMVFRIIHARSPVQPEVEKPVPTARASSRIHNGRIGCYERDPEFPQQIVGAPREPVWVAGLAHHGSLVASAQRREERAGRFQVKTKARRKLKQERTEPSPLACPRNLASAASAPSKRSSWVIIFGALTEKAKPSGTAAAQRS
jgi:hypothetical protein